MKREIKFRAWDTQENKMNTNGTLGAGSWCQLLIIDWCGGISACNAFGLSDGSNPTFDKPLTERFLLMQFTGLQDKNGKDIYEGDILHDSSINAKAVVVFGGFPTLNDDYGISETSPKFCMFWEDKSGYSEINSKNVTVIGNLYEHPHLLNQ